MGNVDIWQVVHAERKAAGRRSRSPLHRPVVGELALQRLDRARSRGPHDGYREDHSPKFFAKMVAAGFSFSKMQAKDIASETGDSPADALARFEAVVTSVKHPPGPLDTMLGETIIHCEDIRRPLGIHRDYPNDAVVQTANFFKGSNLLIGSKRRIAGLSLKATDTDWTTGNGPEVSGPILSLAMAMTGRTAALDDLSGDGLATFRQRS